VKEEAKRVDDAPRGNQKSLLASFSFSGWGDEEGCSPLLLVSTTAVLVFLALGLGLDFPRLGFSGESCHI
jgi:hypothetical protein